MPLISLSLQLFTHIPLLCYVQQEQLQNQYQYFNQAIQEERYRAERLEEQLADLSELHHHALHNVQQELSGIEERLEYRSEERGRDLQDSIEQCATRVSVRSSIQSCHLQLYTISIRPEKGCLVVLHRSPLIFENWKKVLTVQKYTAPNFQNSKKSWFFLWEFWSYKNIF